MNKKRVIALLAAATMLFSTVPVFAVTTTSSGTEVTGGSTTITGDATVNDVDKNKPLKVTLPTSNALKFTVDPHNLVGLTSGQTATIDTSATGQGAILPSNTLAVIKNMSNVPVKVDVNLSLVVSGAAVNLVTDQAAVASGTGANMMLVAVPGTEKAWDDATYTATNQALAVESTSGVDFAYKLDSAKWETVANADGSFTYRYKTDEENNFDAVAFKMGGSVNKAADWAKYTDEAGGYMKLKAVFDVNKAVEADVLEPNSVVYDLASGSAATVGYTPVVAEETARRAYAVYDSSATWFRISESDSSVFGSSVALTNTKVNGIEVQARMLNGFVIINFSDVQGKVSSGPWTFTFKIDGREYTATYPQS